ETIVVADVPVAFHQADIVIQSQRIGLEELLQGRQRRAGWSDVGSDDLVAGVALPVVASEEEQLVFLDWAADGTAELIEMVGLLLRTRAVIAKRVGVHPFVAVKLEGRAVELVGAGLGDDIDGPATRAADLSR